MEQRDIGATLKQQRVSLGVSLSDITLRTRIPVHYLEAIEAGEFERLPGLIFTRSFVAQYCRTLGLAPDELLAALPRIEQAAMPLPDPPVRPTVAATARAVTHSPLFSSLVWVGIVSVGFGAAYLYFDGTTVTTGAAQKSASAAAKSAAKQKEKPQTSGATSSADGQSASSTAPDDGSADDEKKAAGAENSTPSSSDNHPAAPVDVVISATEPSWISLTTDGKTTFTGTLEPNETKEVSAEQQVRLVTGNAAGTSVSLNGKALDPLGAKGQVRILRLTAAGPEFQPKAPPPASTEEDPL